MRHFAVNLPVSCPLAGAWAVYSPFVSLPACHLAASLPAIPFAASLPFTATRQFAVNVLGVGFRDTIFAAVLSGQALSSPPLQLGFSTDCCHYIHKFLLSQSQTSNLQACPAQYIVNEKHPLQQRVSLPGDIIGPKGFSSVPELIKLLTTAVTAVKPGATIKPLREDANSTWASLSSLFSYTPGSSSFS
jgi:hypothetical protein